MEPTIFTRLRFRTVFLVLSTVGCTAVAAWSPTGAQVSTNGRVIANFAQSESTVTEKERHVELNVTFSRPFSGRLKYVVTAGTAERGTDFEVVDVEAGDSVTDAHVVLQLRDDALVEEVETIQVALVPDNGYVVGSTTRHTLTIQDNDEQWRVLHDVEGAKIGYSLRIVRTPAVVTATATSDGGQGVPAGTYGAAVEASVDRFHATIGPIPVHSSQTLLGVKFSRTFVLTAASKKSQKIDYDRMLTGSAVETWSVEETGRQRLGETAIGSTFLMTRTVVQAPKSLRKPARVEAPRGQVKYASATAGARACPAVQFDRPPKLMARAGWADGFDAPWGNTTAFSASEPYANYRDKTLSRVRAKLYYREGRTVEEKEAAAFRYSELLYQRVEGDPERHIRAQFEKVEDWWDCAAKERAYQSAAEILRALSYSPTSRVLRGTLLDIYYEISVAERIVAHDAYKRFLRIALREPAPGHSLLQEEIAALEKVIPVYRSALSVFMGLLRTDIPLEGRERHEPFGSHVFRSEVPHRSAHSGSVNKGGPDRGVAGAAKENAAVLFRGYKDVTLMFELLREYLRATEDLARRYAMRGEPFDRERARAMASGTQFSGYLEGQALLGMFPELEGEPPDRRSGLVAAVAGWRHSLNTLSSLVVFLDGRANILGYTEDYLVLVQPGPAGSAQAFNSYDLLARYVRQDGPLSRALQGWERAKREAGKYEDRNDQLALQFADRREHYDRRLTELVGAKPEDPKYQYPEQNHGGLIRQQHLNIERARTRVKQLNQVVANLEEEVRIEVRAREKTTGIRDGLRKLQMRLAGVNEREADGTIELGKHGSQLDVTREMARVRGAQTFWQNIAGAAASVSLQTSLKPFGIGIGTSVGGGVVSYSLNAFYQEAQETYMGELLAARERLAFLERAKIHSTEAELLDVRSRARIKQRLLAMAVHNIATGEAALALTQETARLAALYLEKRELERRRAESDRLLASRYFADPGYRLLKDAAVVRSESAFKEAQEWMFLTLRAAEYKWSQPFEYVSADGAVFDKNTLFRARNARELEHVYAALRGWDAALDASVRSDDGYKVLSLREDVFGLVSEGGEEQRDSWEAFRRFISREENYLNPDDPDNPLKGNKVLRVTFSTAFTPRSGGLFLPSRWAEKINFLRIKLPGAVIKHLDGTAHGYLLYGGMSLVRKPSGGSDIITYSPRYWFYDKGRWQHRDALGVDIQVYVSRGGTEIPWSVYNVEGLREMSVANTAWTLYIAVESKAGVKLVDVSRLRDIQLHIHYFYNTTNRG